jgi:hypothetical protein
MGAKTYNLDLSHGGGKIAKKPGESKGGRVHSQPPLFYSQCRVYDSQTIDNCYRNEG